MGVEASPDRRNTKRESLLLLIQILVILIVASAILDFLGIYPKNVLSVAADIFEAIIGGVSPEVSNVIAAGIMALVDIFLFIAGLVILLIELVVISIALVGVLYGTGFYWKNRKDTLRDAFYSEVKELCQNSRSEQYMSFSEPKEHVPVYYSNIDRLHLLNSEERIRIVEYYTNVINGMDFSSADSSDPANEKCQELLSLLQKKSNQSIVDELKELQAGIGTGKGATRVEDIDDKAEKSTG